MHGRTIQSFSLGVVIKPHLTIVCGQGVDRPLCEHVGKKCFLTPSGRVGRETRRVGRETAREGRETKRVGREGR